MPEADYPAWPPGLWRRIRLAPAAGRIAAALEDDMHRMDLVLDHDGQRVTGLSAQTLRAPWSACPQAGAHLARDVIGAALADVGTRDPYQHCTHLLDLAILCAARAHDAGPIQLDMRVADRLDERTTATLAENGRERLCWRLDGTVIVGGPQAGLDLRRLSQWKADLPEQQAQWALALRRAVFISGGRHYAPPGDFTAAEMNAGRKGACFNYQPAQAATSRRRDSWRIDFAQPGAEPLAGVDPAGPAREPDTPQRA